MTYPTKKPEIRYGFTNKNGIYFPNVREIAYKEDELFGNLGIYLDESTLSSKCLYRNPFPVYIYQTFDNPNVGYRIYQDLLEPRFNGNDDDKLVQALQERQPNIKLTQFPTGVVTLGGRIIGQEMPLYNGYISLRELFEKYKNIDPIKIYHAIIDIVAELRNNNIYYQDINSQNLIIDPNNTDLIRLIDFEYNRIIFENHSYTTDSMLINLQTMLNSLTKDYGIGYERFNFSTFESVEHAREQVDSFSKKLVK